MAKKDDDGRGIAPQRTQSDRFAVDIRQGDAGEFRAVTLSHGASFSWAGAHLSRLNQHSFAAAFGGRVACWCAERRGVSVMNMTLRRELQELMNLRSDGCVISAMQW
jgi:hypothetical protein